MPVHEPRPRQGISSIPFRNQNNSRVRTFSRRRQRGKRALLRQIADIHGCTTDVGSKLRVWRSGWIRLGADETRKNCGARAVGKGRTRTGRRTRYRSHAGSRENKPTRAHPTWGRAPEPALRAGGVPSNAVRNRAWEPSALGLALVQGDRSSATTVGENPAGGKGDRRNRHARRPARKAGRRRRQKPLASRTAPSVCCSRSSLCLPQHRINVKVTSHLPRYPRRSAMQAKKADINENHRKIGKAAGSDGLGHGPCSSTVSHPTALVVNACGLCWSWTTFLYMRSRLSHSRWKTGIEAQDEFAGHFWGGKRLCTTVARSSWQPTSYIDP